MAEHITSENHKLKTDLTKAISEVDDLKGKLAIANNELENIKDENQEAQAVKETLTKYETLGTVEELTALKENFSKIDAELKEFKAIDPESNPKEIGEVLDQVKTLIEEYKKIGTPESVTEALNALASRIEAYENFGTENEVEELFDLCNQFVEKEKTAKLEAEIKALATELNVEESKVAKVYGRLSVEEIKELFANLPKVADKKENKDNKVEENKKLLTANEVVLEPKKDNEEETSHEFEAPLVERLMKTHMRTNKK